MERVGRGGEGIRKKGGGDNTYKGEYFAITLYQQYADTKMCYKYIPVSAFHHIQHYHDKYWWYL